IGGQNAETSFPCSLSRCGNDERGGGRLVNLHGATTVNNAIPTPKIRRRRSRGPPASSLTSSAMAQSAASSKHQATLLLKRFSGHKPHVGSSLVDAGLSDARKRGFSSWVRRRSHGFPLVRVVLQATLRNSWLRLFGTP